MAPTHLTKHRRERALTTTFPTRPGVNGAGMPARFRDCRRTRLRKASGGWSSASGQTVTVRNARDGGVLLSKARLHDLHATAVLNQPARRPRCRRSRQMTVVGTPPDVKTVTSFRKIAGERAATRGVAPLGLGDRSSPLSSLPRCGTRRRPRG